MSHAVGTVARRGTSPRLWHLNHPHGREAQATEVVSDELEVPEANAFIEGENITRQAFTASSDGERQRWNHGNI
jgi:hypothetical protein